MEAFLPTAFWELVERVERESAELGIPSISREDGFVLQGLALVAGRLGGVVVDAGAGIGYSTLWVIGGLASRCRGGGGGAGCRVVAVEADPVLAGRAREVLGEASRATGVGVEVVAGDALEYLAGLPDESVAMAFIDIYKHQYPDAARLLAAKAMRGGIVVFHNALYPRPPGEFYQLMARRPWVSVVVPTGAGLLVAVKDPWLDG